MALIDLPYLWAATGRHGRLYWFYRRDGHRIPITSLAGKRLFPADAEFVEAWERIHASFEAEKKRLAETGPARIIIGTLGHAVPLFLSDVETTQLAPATQRKYKHYLNELLYPRREGEESHADRLLGPITPEAVRDLRDERKESPHTANGRLASMSAFLSWVEGRPLRFRLPKGWRNPALSVKMLKTSTGHRPWEENELDEFYCRWKLGTLQHVLAETFVYTGQRLSDVAKMQRLHYRERDNRISVIQQKTGARVPIFIAKRFKAALDPWLASHPHKAFFPDANGEPMSASAIGLIMADAIEAAGLPDECTPHGLRYTAATRLIELGLDYDVIASITGHKTLGMVRKYTAQERKSRLATDTLDRAEQRRAQLENA